MENGEQQEAVQLHGPVAHLLLHRGKLHAATTLGDATVLDLEVLEQDYCKLLAQIWRQVPVEWRDGRVHRRRRPGDHRCNRR